MALWISRTWSRTYPFKKDQVAVTEWTVHSTPLTEGGKITGFNNELLVHVRYNMSASPNALKFAAGKDGEIQHVRDALRAASMANGYRNRTFYSARDIAANTARGLIGTNISGEAAKATMEGSLGDWARQSMQDSHVQWDGLYKPHWYVE